MAALAVVPEPGDDAAERLRAGVEDRPAGMVLEPRQRPTPARLELALDQHVADHPARPRDRVERQKPDAGLLLAALVAVEATQELVSAADG